MNNRVKEIRKEKKLTQKAFGELIGMKPNSISDIESGKNSVTEYVIKSICREFKVNEVWLRTGGGDKFERVSSDDRYSLNLGKLATTENEFVENIVNQLAESSPEKIRIIEEFMKGCLGL